MADASGCRKAVRERLLSEMLAGVVDPLGAGWKVLIMDTVTTRVMSSALKMSDLQEAGVSVVEDLDKAREPLAMPAVYFITPSPASVSRLVADFSKVPMYPSVHVFFSSRVTADAVDRIKKCPVLLPLLKTLKEVNLEFFMVDSRTVITDHPKALVRLMGDRAEAARADAERELDAISGRLAGLFATLNEFPSIRYKAGRAAEPGDPPGAASRATLTHRLAHKLHERAVALQRAGALPPRETCDLVVVDRSIDPVAPVMHEWTYESMVYDMLPVEGNVIRYVAEAASGRQEQKDHILDEGDETWVELRHAHIADVFTTLAGRFKDFQSKNKAAKYQAQGRGDGASMTGANIKGLIQALPQFREILGRLSVHIWISSELKNITNARDLTALGELEQDLVYGDRGGQDLIKHLAEASAQMDPLDKIRLFVAYLATHPEKMDATKKAQWQKIARMDPRDMATVCNLAYLNVAVMKQQAQPKGMTFGLRTKKKTGAYRKREGREESNYALARFDPLLLDLMEDAASGKLQQDAYPFLRAPAEADDFAASEAVRVASARTNRSAVNWARKGSSNAAADAGSGPSGGPGTLMGYGASASGSGRRLVVFVIGGVTRSEMRAAHLASKALGRDIVLASTNVLKPAAFADQLAQLGSAGAELI